MNTVAVEDRGWNDSDLVEGALSLSGRSLRRAALLDVPRNLRELSLSTNMLTALDLSPLSACSALESLSLCGNELGAIDLSPLANCSRLQKLWLHNNALKKVDISPLGECPRLRSLYLDGNKIDSVTVDLSPLENCKMLRALRLGRNGLAGELDITPIMSCDSLTLLDVSASVRLIAGIKASSLSAQAATNALPPALRRKAATVVWKSIPDEVAEDEAEEVSTDDDSVDSDVLDTDNNIWDNHVNANLCTTTPGGDLCVCSGPCKQPGALEQPKLTRSKPRSPLYELQALGTARRIPGSYTALLIGFRGDARYAIETLLAEHASMTTICITSGCSEVSPSSLVNAGALMRCHVILMRPQAESMILGLRAYDAAVPIIVIGNTFSGADAEIRSLEKGATSFFPEPLSTRDALMIKMHAQKRARSISCSPRKRSASSADRTSRSEGECVCDPTRAESAPELAIPTSPITSSESSPPTGVPTAPYSTPFPKEELKAFWAPETKEENRCFVPEYGNRKRIEHGCTHPMVTTRLPAVTKTKIDFRRLRKPESRSNSLRAKLEDSTLHMVFSRCGGAAGRDSFHTIASKCDLPSCVGPLLYDAAKKWTERLEANGEGGQVQIRRVHSLSSRSSSPSFQSVSSRSPSPRRSMSCSSFDPKKTVSYEQFLRYWKDNLRGRSGDERLFTTVCIANQFSKTVSLTALSDLAINFMTRKCSAEKYGASGEQTNDSCTAVLAAEVVCYELQGHSRSRLSQSDIVRSSLCSSLYAAERGIFNGVTSSLRIDRLRVIQDAFSEACCARTGEASLQDIIAYNGENGLLTPRAVEAVFARHVQRKNMTMYEFAPMWLAATDVGSLAAASYLFGILDMDQDGYVNAVDCAHFYSQKCNLLEGQGSIPVKFECIWQSVLDNLRNGRSVSVHGRSQISLPEVLKMPERDREVLLKSVLFMEDDMASVDLTRTASSGGESAAKRARECFDT